ncbi:hypothetical protein ACP70R_004774 [Stipagrostis hirtigluma subsp. patula]
MAAEKGEKGPTAEEKVVAAVEKGEKGPTAEKVVGAMEKGEKGTTAEEKRENGAADAEKGEMPAAEKVQKGELAAKKAVNAPDEEKGATSADKGERRPRLRRWKRAAKVQGATVEEKEKKGATAAAGEEVSGEKAIFFFRASGKVITLMSKEGMPFKVPEAAARLSGVLADMVDKGCAGDNIPLPNVDARALATVIKYCNKHATAAAAASTPDADVHGVTDGDSSSGINTAASEETLEEWDRKLVDGLTQDALYDLLVAANFLDINGLLSAAVQKVADMIKGHTPEQIRKTFNIANDFTEEKEEEIRKESPWAFDDDD